MVAQLLLDETIAPQDREVHEQNIKDSAASSFIGKEVVTYPPVRHH